MIFKGECSIKINLTLRVLGKRKDGYHDIHSLYWRRRSPEILEIKGFCGEDRLLVDGMDIPGENLVTKACNFLRARYKDKPIATIPPLDMRLVKCLPMGSGIGAGSGNAAAFVRWFFKEFAHLEIACTDAASIGADVAFLASDYDLALAEGIGDRLECVDGSFGAPCETGGLDLPGVLLFPGWGSDTAQAFASIDSDRENGIFQPTNCQDARKESQAVLCGLNARRTLGLLPNDFIGWDSSHAECYSLLYGVLEKAGALAWGLCGSGSSCFALFDKKNGPDAVSRLIHYLENERTNLFQWLHKTLVLE
jgi:4-diphosphocytidyl-2-C-methyl-D-erythritol kinase